jgi:hypothetical protein
MLSDIYESNSQFLKAADLGGQKPVVEIETAEIRENNYGGEKKKQIVLTFVGKDKVLGLNFTNATRISQLIGTEDFEDWIGWRIRLYTDQTKLQNGQTVDCIRIFPDLPEQTHEKARAATAGGETEDIPF